MESIGTISEGEWSSFSGICPDEADFMAQLLGNCYLPSGSNAPVSSSFWPSHDSNVNISGGDEISSVYSSDETNTSMYSFSHGSSYDGGSGVLFHSSSHESCYPNKSNQILSTNNAFMPMDFGMMEGKHDNTQVHIQLSNNVVNGNDFLSQEVSNDSFESNGNLADAVLEGKNLQHRKGNGMVMQEPSDDDKVHSPPDEMSKKRPRIPGDIQKNKRNMKLRTEKSVSSDNDEDNTHNHIVLQRQNSNSYCSEDESNASHELNGVASSSSSKGSGALNLTGKNRASRGSATDPQSLYARKRRERINERLKILQNLVPNGTKVDISTMLEEAVQYVKFLQLQIKLLSSDDMWMYAPIAYNGMDIGLDRTLTTPKSES